MLINYLFLNQKTGRWNAMHVRIAWEIYYHQNKQNSEKPACTASGVCTNHSNSISVNSGSASSSGSGIVNTSSGTAVSCVGITPSNIPSSVSSGNVVPPSGSAVAMGVKSSPVLTLSSTSPHVLNRSGPELASASPYARSPFETSPLSASFIGAPPSHIGEFIDQYKCSEAIVNV